MIVLYIWTHHLCFVLETGSHVSQTGFTHTMYLRMTLNFWSSSLRLPSAGFTSVYHHVEFFHAVMGIKSRTFHRRQPLTI